MPAPAWLGHLSQDLGYGLRILRNNPGFAAITVLTLALGIGANTAMFSVVDSVLLRPLPYHDPGRLVTAGEVFAKTRGTGGFSAGSLLDWREHNRVFEGLAGWARRGFNLSGPADLPERVDGMAVSWDFFQILGVAPALGRGFSENDGRPGAPRVAVLSHALWQRRFGGDPGTVGRSVTVDREACTIIGVMPRRFRFFHGPEMWMPFALDRAQANRTVYFISGVARLKPGVSLSQARAQTDGIVKSAERADPKAKQEWSARVEPLADAFVVQKERERVLILLGAVGFVLLISCANVANLLLARAVTRRRELAVRAALGAGRGRLLRQLLTEGVVFALAGGLLGLLLAFWAVRFVPALVSPSLLWGRAQIAVDSRVLAFTLALSIFTGLFFGIFPAWRASGFRLHDALKEGGRGLGGGAAQGRFRSLLVVAEIALSLVLLVCSGLMIRSLLAMQEVDLGFRRDRLLTMQLAMPGSRYSADGPARAFYRQVLDAAGSIHGVRGVSLSMGQAPWGAPEATAFQIAGHPPPPPSQVRAAAFERVSHDYFRTMGIRLRKGRSFTDRDDEHAPPVAIVNQTFVTMYLPKEEPIGQRVLRKETLEIVGVVADVKFGGPDANTVPMLYVPMLQFPRPGGALALLVSAEPMSLVPSVRAALARIDPDTPVTQVKTMDRIALDSMAQPRAQTGLMSAFAAVALLLSALGIYGVMSCSVAQSKHDMGIRMALGATSGNVLKLVLARGLRLTVAGLLAGLAGAFALTRLLSGLLFQVKPVDPSTFVAVPLLLALVALVAAFLPARRATRVDPVAALRAE
jgi:putative ABC transport system permease protein